MRQNALRCAAYFVLGALFTLLWVTDPAPGFGPNIKARTAEPVCPHPVSASSRKPGKIPPCGEIEAIEIPFANPDGLFPDREARLETPKWFFQGFSESRLSRFLCSCELRPAEKAVLLDKRFWNTSPDGCVISPPDQLLWSLSHRGRQQIYSVLANSVTNYPQCFPFRFPLDGFDRKFKESGLAGGQLEKIRRLTYTNSGDLCFADLRAAQGVLKPNEFNELIQTLYAMPVYLLRLHVSPDSDLETLIRYWGKAGRQKLVAPLLSSMARVPGGAAINISYLLPPFARLRLYTYPEAWNDQTAPKQDCVFTALNFFNETMDTNFFDITYKEKFFNSQYALINDDPIFGDLVTLIDGQNQAFHTCVYIADGFVFTKNGANPAQPWVLMKMSDMLVMYHSLEKSSRVLFLRRKELG